MVQTENSKLRLKLLLSNHFFRINTQQGSIDILHEIVHECCACPETGQGGEEPKSRNGDEKLRQLQDIEDRLRALQLMKDQTTLLLRMCTAWLKDKLTDREGDDMQEIIYRLTLMLETNDSVWLLCDSLDWLVPEVQNILKLQQTSSEKTNQCPGDEQERIRLLHRFRGRLEDWRERTDKQKWLYVDMSLMLQCWPKYPSVR